MPHKVNGKVRAGGAELVAQARAGDRTAFAALYVAHRDDVFKFLYNQSRNRQLAEDLTQDVFLRALRRLETFNSPRSSGFAGWLMVIARNIYLDHVKLARTRLETPVSEMADGDQRDRSAESSALRQLDIAEAAETVAAALAGLTPYQRECVRLRFLEGLSVPETAARLGKGIGVTKTVQFRALQQMRSTLTAEAVAA
ncbi:MULTISPECIES: RNA polymerase sigma factor [Streptomyces]|uniref:RNA polymerase sigma factor n=1 Tax=Streptomyces TaxID=1883 RepID=UPI0005ED3627|nr:MULTISPECIES: RNA polymerase sigma factor [Streptomyces]